jgi:hypothetical protein
MIEQLAHSIFFHIYIVSQRKENNKVKMKEKKNEQEKTVDDESKEVNKVFTGQKNDDKERVENEDSVDKTKKKKPGEFNPVSSQMQVCNA